ncbi:MAG: M42 family metallopeptidase [Oscillospiraceae bacterium]|nr:M42 family metallopeptidase [Oscillospiraceae bacterium]
MLLEKLTTACGLPGFEDEVRDIIKAELEGHVDSLKVDRIGNLVAYKKGKKNSPHVALSAHMDEVGLCVTGIEKDGTLKFESWGVDGRLLPSMHVAVGNEKLPGVVGCKPIHLQKDSERKSVYELDAMYIDIGCDSKEETEKLVNKGDFVAFVSEFTEFGDNQVKAKALDDRVGCAAIIELLKSDLPYSVTGIFCVQEEVGLRGSAMLSKSLEADLVINIEGTICADMEGVDEDKQVTNLGAGPCLSLLDMASVYQKKYLEAIVKVAEDEKIPYQYRKSGMGATDAGKYHTGGTGIPCIGIAVPCRYIHSPVSVMHKCDFENLIKLVKAFIINGAERVIGK